MNSKGKHGFFELDRKYSIIYMHIFAQVIAHSGLFLMLGKESSQTTERLNKIYKEYQVITHILLFLFLLAGVNEFA